MPRLPNKSDGRIRYDTQTGAVRSFFGGDLVAMEPQEAREAAAKTVEQRSDDFLATNRDLFKLESIDLHQIDRVEGSTTESIRYVQHKNGVPVLGCRLVVGFNKDDGRVISAVSTVDYDIPTDLGAGGASFSAERAVAAVRERLAPRFRSVEILQPNLFIYRLPAVDLTPPPYGAPPIRHEMLALGTGEIGRAYLVWQILVDTRGPDGNWEAYINANDGELLAVHDRRVYQPPRGQIFWPDPIRSSQNAALSWATDEAVLNSERRVVALDNLDAPQNQTYSLNGDWVRNLDKEDPDFAPPTTTTDFFYNAKQRSFLNVMAYYYIDRLVMFLRGFGIPAFNNAVTDPINVDPQGLSGSDNSHFVPTGTDAPYIAFGEGGVPDASDPGVIVHEYGHALHHYMLGSHSNGSYEEGFNDFLAACWLDRFNEHQFQRESVFPWDNNAAINWGPKRRVDLPERFDDHSFDGYGMYLQGDVHATALWNVYVHMGGASPTADVRRDAADRVIRLYMEMLVIVQNNRPIEDLVNGLITADENLYSGRHRAIIQDAYRRRGLWAGLPFAVLSVCNVASRALDKKPPLSVRTDIYAADNPQDRTLREQLKKVLTNAGLPVA